MAITDQWLHKLIPTSSLWAWYPLNDTTDLISSDGVKDESGNGYDLLSDGSPDAVYETGALNGHPVVVHDGSALPVKTNNPVTLKHIFMVLNATDDSAFSSNQGIISDDTSVAVLVGSSAASIFTDLSYGGNFSYIKSQTSYAESAQAVPFSNYELIELNKNTGGFPLANLQIGENKALTQYMKGKWAELICFTSSITGNELTALRLYFDLKFGLWKINGTPLVFPNPSILNVHGTEKYSEYLQGKKSEPDFDAVTIGHEYEDGGMDFVETNENVPERWKVSILGIKPEQADVYDAFYRQARIANSFTFTDKYGEVHTGVRIERNGYSRSHSGHKSWRVDCRFNLIKYP